MTAIVGIACQDGNVILGADSLASDSDSRFVVKTPKLWRLVLRERGKRRDLVIGYTTSFRMGDLLRVHMGNVSVRQGLDAEEFLIAEFVPALRGVLSAGGFLKRDSDREEGGELLVGIDGRLFAIQSDFSVIEPAGGEIAVGSGQQFALGALHATTGQPDARKRIRAALAAAAYWSPSVGGDLFTIGLKE